MKLAKLAKRPSFKAVFKDFNYVGLLGATIGFCLSFLPSLLPRPWLFQGLVTGFSTVIGYGCGTTLSWALRWLLEWEPPRRLKQMAWRLLAIFGPTAGAIYLYLSAQWQNQVRELVGEHPQEHRFVFRILAVAVVTFFVVLYVSRFIRFATRQVINVIDKLLPRKVSIIAGIFLVVYGLVTIFSGVFFASFVRFANKTYDKQNDGTPPKASRPEVPNRSGGPGSLVSWESLGYQGRGFVGRGPSQQQLSNFNGAPSQEPIRVYAGLHSAPSLTERAELVVKELERTKAFEREVLVIANATGTGWIEPQAVDSLEYMYNGDTAVASLQYSYLPSWLSFIVDKHTAKKAGQELFNAVYGKWATYPEDNRPKLISYGLSLGAYAGQAAFSGANDLRFTTDGALFVGTPSDTELWETITNNRDPGSKQVEPVYQQGRYIRFESNGTQQAIRSTNWSSPRTLYLQHASDPVIWFNPDLIFNEPDWLTEERGTDVTPSMQWYPFITFTQVALDQFLGNSSKSGHGHHYANRYAAAWSAVLQPEDWTSNDTERLQKIIDTYENE